MAARKPLSELSPAYRRRIERAEAAGKTRAEARGHRQEATEKRERRARVRAETGVSIERRARIWRQGEEHMFNTLSAAQTRNRVDRAVIRKHIRLLPLDVITDFILQANAPQLQGIAHYDYDELILRYPELENDAERNPIWYAPDASYAR